MIPPTNVFGSIHDACFLWVRGPESDNPLPPEAKQPLPSRGTAASAGFDMRAVESVELQPGQVKLIGTGWAVCPPCGHAGFLLPRSGKGHQGLVLGNLVGLIDQDYRGELKVSLWNRTQDEVFSIKAGDKVAQLVFLPASMSKAVEVTALGGTERGDGGFGSTGK